MLKRRRRPGGVELGRRLRDLPPAQSGSITFVLAASGLVSVGLEIVAVTTLLHDLGFTKHGAGPHRFEVNGANVARARAIRMK